MPEMPESVKATLRGFFQIMIENMIKGFGEAAKKIIDQITQDVFNVKGHWDDTVVNLIKATYRKVRGEEAYGALMRLIGFLTVPEHQEFGVISIGALALTYKGEVNSAEKTLITANEEKSEKPLSIVEKNFAFFLKDFDFENKKNYSVLFKSWDFLVSDFQRLEAEARDANRDVTRNEVVRLMHESSLYADETLKKRLAGALMHVRDWPATLRRWAKKGWGQAVKSFQAIDDYLNTELGKQAQNFRQTGADALTQVRERFQNHLQR